MVDDPGLIQAGGQQELQGGLGQWIPKAGNKVMPVAAATGSYGDPVFGLQQFQVTLPLPVHFIGMPAPECRSGGGSRPQQPHQGRYARFGFSYLEKKCIFQNRFNHCKGCHLSIKVCQRWAIAEMNIIKQLP